MRPLWLRLIGGLAVLAAGVGGVLVGWYGMFLWWSLAPLLGALVMVVMAPIAAWPVFAGRWAREGCNVLQLTALVFTLLAYLGIGLYATARAVQAVSTRDVHATPALECAGWIALAAGTALVVATVIVAAPRDERDVLLAAVAGLLALAGVGGVGAAAAIASGPSSCERFTFSRAAWRADRTPVAEGLVRCRTLVGLDEHEVQRLLGGRLGRTEWSAGFVDDGFFGAEARLSVRYGDDGRVRATRLDYVRR